MKKRGFTLAEVLISLVVIGIITAMMIPSLLASMNEKTWNTQRKALQVRLATVLAGMGGTSGYGTYKESTGANNVVSVTDTAAESFVIQGISKNLKIKNVCTNDNFTPCHIADKIANMQGTIMDTPKTLAGVGIRATNTNGVKDTKAAAFETANEESIVVYYNPFCTNELKEFNGTYEVEKTVCATFMYDLNGLKGPNQIGKDMGIITAIYSGAPDLVSPIIVGTVTGPSKVANNQADIGTLCSKLDPDSSPATIEEITALYANRNLIGGVASVASNGYVWSSTIVPTNMGLAWRLFSGSTANQAIAQRGDRAQACPAICVKR